MKRVGSSIFLIICICFMVTSCPKKKNQDNVTVSEDEIGSLGEIVNKEDSLSETTENEIGDLVDSEPKEEAEDLSTLTMAQQIQLQKVEAEKLATEGELSADSLEGKGTTSNTVNASSPAVLNDEKKEFTLPSGEIVFQNRIGHRKFLRKDDQFSFKREWSRITPADFRIGQLADKRSTQYMNKKIVENLTAFFVDFADGTINDSFLNPESAILVQNNLNYYIDSSALPDSLFRIGKIGTSNNGVVRVNTRFYYNESCADGEITLEENVDSGIKDWLISDIQVDFMQLLKPYEKPSGPFLPSSYNYFDWE